MAGRKVHLVVRQTIEAIQGKNRNIRCERHKFATLDPTDHRAIFDFLKKEIPEIRDKYHGRELVIHISPGTPSMQTIWVLMGECGLIEPPFTLVKSYRASERAGRQAVVPVTIGIETFYKAYRESKPSKLSSETEVIVWDPRRFQSLKARRAGRRASRRCARAPYRGAHSVRLHRCRSS
jgi:hypothetical protein